MLKPYLELNLGISILEDSYTLPEFNQDIVKIFRVDYEYLNPEFVFIFQKYAGSRPSNIQLFYTPPNTVDKNIHTDGSNSNTMWAINQVISGTRNGIMRWFKSNKPTQEYNTSGISTKYSRYDISEVEEIDRHIIKDSSLVEIGIPHNIDNYDNEPRWCLSIRPERYQFTYQELYNRFTNQPL